jgi:hypothetical protein
MTRALTIAAALALLLSPVVHAQTYRTYGSEAFFAVDWEPGERRGRPVVTGHVVNTYGIPTHNVRLLVESLDAAGQPTGTTIGYVSGDVVPGARIYFEVPVERPAPAYRVVVLSWDWKSGQSGLLTTPSPRGG